MPRRSSSPRSSARCKNLAKRLRLVSSRLPHQRNSHISALKTMGARLVAGLTISVAEILGRPGNLRKLRIAEPMQGVATALARLDPGRIEASLRIEAVVEGVLVTGPVRGQGVFTCARCLKESSGPIEVEACELFSTPERIAETEDDDAYAIAGTDIDLEPMLRDVVALSLPLNPHCAEDCAGMCAACGRTLVDGSCDCTQEERDPRWAGLEALKDRLA